MIERIDELARAARCAGPALRAFQRAGIPSFSALTECTEPDLTALHGMGPQVMSVLKTSQAERGLPEEGSNG